VTAHAQLEERLKKLRAERREEAARLRTLEDDLAAAQRARADAEAQLRSNTDAARSLSGACEPHWRPGALMAAAQRRHAARTTRRNTWAAS
jgi:chromosome segregation ATPase